MPQNSPTVRPCPSHQPRNLAGYRPGRNARRPLLLVMVLLLSAEASAQINQKFPENEIAPDKNHTEGIPVAQPAGGTGEPQPGEAVSTNAAPDVPVDARVEEAGQRYERGLRLYEEGDYELAAIEFERAYDLIPHYRALFNIGQVHVQLGNYAQAHAALTRYLDQGSALIPQERRAAVIADLEMLKGRIGRLTVTVNISGAEILINDVVAGVSPLAAPLWVDAGRKRVSARKQGFISRWEPVVVAGRDELTLSLALVPEPARVVVRQVSDSNPELWKWAAWSATGVFAVSSAVTGALGVAAANDLKAKRDALGATRSELDSASRRASTLLLSADILGGVALVSAGVATYLTLWAPAEQRTVSSTQLRSVRLALQPSGVHVRGTF